MGSSYVEQVARAAIRPRSTDPPWMWAEKNITVDKTSPFPGKYKSTTAPWTMEPMEVFADNRVRELSIMCSAQSGKTQMVMILLAWAIAEDPGPAMWVQAAQDEAKTFAKTRLMPTLESCAPVVALFPEDRHSKTTLEINFASMPLVINGANSQSKLQSKPIRWLFLDEVRNYPAGAFEMVSKRTRAFWNARKVLISTPNEIDDHVDRAFKEGDQRVYLIACPECSERHELEFENLKWTTDETTFRKNKWDYDALTPTIRYVCPKCQAELPDRPDIRKKIANSGIWKATNPDAPMQKVSFRWSALLPPWVRWSDLVQEFLASRAAMKLGSIEPFKTFRCESLGLPWSTELTEEDVEIDLPKHDDAWPWKDEKYRFATVDVQKDHFYFLVRAWSSEGKSRLVYWGKPTSFEDLEALREQYNVEKHLLFIDAGYNANRVYSACNEYGWTCLKGGAQKDFTHKSRDGKTLKRAFSQKVQIDPGQGTSKQGRLKVVPLFHWSNPTCKDILANLRDGNGAEWLAYAEAGEDYQAQMFSEKKVQRHDRVGQVVYEWRKIGKRQNHLWDCECMQIVAALMGRVLRDF